MAHALRDIIHAIEDGKPPPRRDKSCRAMIAMGLMRRGPYRERGGPTFLPNDEGRRVWETHLRFGT
jgi:hypothetical protein